MVGIRRGVGEKGQVVIPKQLREEFNISPLDCVEFDLEDGKITLRKVNERDPLEAFSEAKRLAKRKFTEADFKKINLQRLYEEEIEGRVNIQK